VCAFLLQKGAHAALSSEAWQEIRVGMTKGRVALPLAFVTVDDEQQVPPLRSGRDDNSVSGRTKEQVEEAFQPLG
jgi:hypothetical protein